MPEAMRQLSPSRRQPPIIRHVVPGGPQRDAAEAFVRAVFRKHYAAEVPVDQAVSRLAGQPVARERIVEVGNLAAERAGSSVDVILRLAAHLDRLGFEWVCFTATRELIGIFRKLGLAPLALAAADPARLGEQASSWGSYYETDPVVVAGRIRLAVDREIAGD